MVEKETLTSIYRSRYCESEPGLAGDVGWVMDMGHSNTNGRPSTQGKFILSTASNMTKCMKVIEKVSPRMNSPINSPLAILLDHILILPPEVQVDIGKVHDVVV
jgi:hypothetical protein